MSRKKSLWKILNTPVQDLLKEEGWKQSPDGAEATEATSPEKAASPTTVADKTEVEPRAVHFPTAPLPPEALDAIEEPSTKIAAEPVEEKASETISPEALAKEDNKSAEEDTASQDDETEEEKKESDWLKSFKDMFWLGLGKDKPRLNQSEKQSWMSRVRQRLSKTRTQFVDNIHRLAKGRTKVDEDMLEELEEILLTSDVGLNTTDRILDHLRGLAKESRFLPEEVVPALTTYLESELLCEPFKMEKGKLNIFLVVGVNGTGKTTTVGKIAAKLKISGYKVMLAAGDTFRAAAIDQLGIWGKRVGAPVIAHHEGADAAAVIYDAIQSARAKKVDALLIDTAGRLHNKDHLMEELQKIHRIIEREKGDDRVENLLVLDATTGQNGIRQAEVFSKSVPLNGLILTKLDGTAKGGVIFAIKQDLNIPIKLVGIGEHLEDLQEFDPKEFVNALFMGDDEFDAEEQAQADAESNSPPDPEEEADT